MGCKFPLRPPRLVWGWPRRHLGRVGGGSLGCDNGISPRRPGTAEQLAWGPAGGVRGADPLGSTRMARRRAHHLTEGETKAQTPGTAQTLTLASWETGYLSHLFHLPQCCLGSPTHGAMWEAVVPSGLVSPTGKYAPAASGAPPLISSCPGSLRPTLQDLERYLQRNLTASQKRRPSPGTPDALKTRSSLLRISSPRLQESALECPSAPSANPSEQALLPTLTPAPWICHKQPSPSFMPPDLSLCSFHHLECSSPT